MTPARLAEIKTLLDYRRKHGKPVYDLLAECLREILADSDANHNYASARAAYRNPAKSCPTLGHYPGLPDIWIGV